MTPGVFNLKYLSFYWVKIQKQGQFWKAENMQIEIDLTFGIWDLRKLWPKNKQVFFVDMVYVYCICLFRH